MISSTAIAQTNTWSGEGANTNWNTVGNWSLNAVPTAANDVVIPTGFTVNLNVATAVKSIVVQGSSTLNINGNLSFTNASSFAAKVTVNWANSSLIGGGTLTNNGTINVTTAGSKYISGATKLVNNGTITFPISCYFYLYDTSILDNTASGIIDFKSDAIITYSGSDAHNLNNSGLIKKTAGDGNSQIQAFLTNTGTISVESGTLTLNSKLKTFNGGIYNVTTGKELVLSAIINVSNTLTGVLNGYMNWTDNIAVATTATFNFTGTKGVNWSSGSLIGGGNLTSLSPISLDSASSKYISAATTLTNKSTITFPVACYFYLYDTSKLDNTTSGIIDFKSDAIITYSGSAAHNLNNAGLIKKTAGVGNAQIQAFLNNTGTISSESGILTLNGKEKTFTGGIYNVTAGNELVLATQINVSSSLKGLLNGAMKWTDNVAVASTATCNFTGTKGLLWNSGSLIGGGNLESLSPISIESGASKYISAVTTLTNKSTITFANDCYFYLYDTSKLENTASGTIDFKSESIITYSGSEAHNLNNAGLIKKTAGSGNTQIQSFLTNTGTFSIESGKLTLNSKEKTFIGGIYNVSADKELALATQINVSKTLTGLLNGAMNWTDNVAIASTATFNFTGSKGLVWSSGSLIGGGNLTNSSKISIESGASKYISGATTLTNTSTITFPFACYLYLYDTSKFENNATGIIDFKSESIITYSGALAHNLNNAGLIKKSAGEGNTQIQSFLSNNGTITVESGILTFNGKPKTLNGGKYNVTAGETLILSSLTNVNSTLTGVLDGYLQWSDDVSATTTATFNFTGSKGVNWASGSLIGGGTLKNLSTISLDSANSKYISGVNTVLENSGKIIFPVNCYFYLYNNAMIKNMASGIIDFQSDSLITYSGSDAFSISNAGLITKTVGTGISSIAPPVTNSGIIDAKIGTLQFADTFTLTNTVDGVIKGIATIDLPVPAKFIDNGTFAPGGLPGTLAVTGVYKSSSTSVLDVEINGLTQSTQYDLLAITGTNAVFEGKVKVTLGYDAKVGDKFTIATVSGTIDTKKLVTPIYGNYGCLQYTFDVSYPNTNSVVLTMSKKGDVLEPTAIAKNITVQLDAAGKATVTAAQVNNGSTDNCTAQANLVLTLNKSSFTCSNLGANAVILTVKDEAGNTANANATVTVEDKIKPVMNCKSDIAVSAGNNGFTVPDYYALNEVTATDNCSIATAVQTPAPNTVINVAGTTPVTITVTDGSGNSATCTFNLEVGLLATNDFKLSEAISLFPNPTSGIVTLKNSNNLELISASVIDISGRILNVIDLKGMNNQQEISLERYSNGNYFIKIETANSSIIKQIIKK